MPHWIALATVACLARPGAAVAAPTLGFVENWPGTTISGWVSGQQALSNPGTGGFSGIGDGFLELSTGLITNFGAYYAGPEYTGDWTAAGITQVRVELSDLATADALEIHFSLGRDQTSGSPDFWQYNVGFIPPVNAWGDYVVDLTKPADWTRIIGTALSATFASALSNCQKILLRHVRAPFEMFPDQTSGDLGIDHLLLTNGTVGVEPPARLPAARPVQLAPPAPNPSRGRVALALETFASGPVHVRIVDALGRIVRRVELADGPAGSRSWTWDGADDRGRPAAPGGYRVRAWSAAGGMSRPLIRLR